MYAAHFNAIKSKSAGQNTHTHTHKLKKKKNKKLADILCERKHAHWIKILSLVQLHNGSQELTYKINPVVYAGEIICFLLLTN